MLIILFKKLSGGGGGLPSPLSIDVDVFARNSLWFKIIRADRSNNIHQGVVGLYQEWGEGLYQNLYGPEGFSPFSL